MALLLPTSEYLAIEYVEPSTAPNQIVYRLHKDADARARYKAGTLGKYETTLQLTATASVDLSAPVDPSKSIKDSLITASYEALKKLPEFAGATDI